MTKEEKIEEINSKVDAARLEAHMTAAPIVLERELEQFVSDWEERHPEFTVWQCEYDFELKSFGVRLSETGEKPLYLKVTGGCKKNQQISASCVELQESLTAAGALRIMNEAAAKVKSLEPMADGMINVIKGDA